MLAEMVMLSLIARKLYKKILPEQDSGNLTQTHISTIGAIMASDSYGTIVSNNNNINCSNNNKISDRQSTAQVGYTNSALEINEK